MSAPTTTAAGNPKITGIEAQYSHGPINLAKTWWIWLVLSLLMIIPGLVFMGMSMAQYETHSPLRLGIDFTGGTMVDFGVQKKLTSDDTARLSDALAKAGIPEAVVQLQQDVPAGNENPSQKTPPIANDQSAAKAVNSPTMTDFASIVSIRTKSLSAENNAVLMKTIRAQYGEMTLLQRNTIGPILAGELIIKAAWALMIAFIAITAYLTLRFKLDYAVTAFIALAHDAVFLVGIFSVLGWLFHIEINSMFVTALLTTIGFSVHDTIVVFDRIRENSKKLYTLKLPFAEVANISVNQTLHRSINTSLTALLTLLALYLFGGDSTKTFVLALLLGIAAGTYSSIFVASSLLTKWRMMREAQPA